jgi:hypothetical protein
MRRTQGERLVGKQGGVNAAEHDPRTAFAGEAADLVPAQGVSGVDADSNDIARLDRCRIEHFQGFIRNEGVAELPRGGRG